MTKQGTVLFFSILLFLSPVLVNGQDASVFIDKGRTAYEEGKYEEALRYFDNAIRKDPRSPDGYEYRGNVYFIQKNFASAEQDFSRALEAYFRTKTRSSSNGTHTTKNMTIIEPNRQNKYSMLYNNRGASRYFQGKRREAVEDFDIALQYDPDLKIAQTNKKNALRDKPDFNFADQGSDGGSEYMYSRPISGMKPVDPRKLREESQSLREARSDIYDGGSSRGIGLFKPKEFSSRKVSRRGKVYKSPLVSSASHNYIKIDKVTITDKATIIDFVISNPERKSFDVSIDSPGYRSEGAFYLTDRSGYYTYSLKSVDGIAQYPETTPLPPQEPVKFTLTFAKIHDNVGFINVVEGNKQNGEEWNFYGVDLTKSR